MNTSSGEWLTVFAGFLLLNVTYAATQPALTFNGGRGEDAGRYYSMAEQALRGDRYQSRPTFANAGLVTLIVGIGAAFRETTMVIGIALLLNRDNVRRAASWLPLIAGIASLVIVNLSGVTTASGYATWTEGWRFLRDKPLQNYALAWLLVFGPMLAMPLFFWRRSLADLVENPALGILLGAFAVLAWVGGTDTERLLVFASPVVYVLMARSIGWARVAPLSIAMIGLAAVQAASARVFTSIHGSGTALTQIEKAGAYQNLWTEFCPPKLLLLYGIGYGLMAVVIVTWLATRGPQVRLKPDSTKPLNA